MHLFVFISKLGPKGGACGGRSQTPLLLGSKNATE
jgi:hypothetical protein